MCHNMVEWEIECMLMSSQGEWQKPVYHPYIHELRVKNKKVFSDITLGKPLDQGIDHIIELEEGEKPVMVTPYQHPKQLKDEIEKKLRIFSLWDTLGQVSHHLPHQLYQ